VRYRTLGNTQLSLSVVGLGTWQLGGEWGHSFSQNEADAILDKAAESGINFIDTAECYGNHLSEEIVGNYLKRRKDTSWIVATKFGHHFKGFMNRTEDFSVAGVHLQLEASLRALGVAAIDLYQFHSGSDEAFANPELWSMLEQQKKAGKIRYLGLSIRSKGSELQARQARAVGAEVLQVVYNRLDRRPEEWVFPEAQRQGLGILARVPLASGLLSGKYSGAPVFPATDVRATFAPEKLSQDLGEVNRIRREEVPPGVRMGPWALAWCLQNPIVCAVIPGSKNPDQVSENATASEL
jgi:aryl-alcohol dehydrogenase-like predicted oxidoreductase